MFKSQIASILSSRNRGWQSKSRESRGGVNTYLFNISSINTRRKFSEFSPRTYMDENIISVLEAGGRVFAFDMNGELNQYSKPMGAESLSLRADMSLSINPYTNIPEKVLGGEGLIRNDMLSLLREIIFFMAMPSSDTHRMVVDQALNHAWLKEGSGASLDTVVEFLMNHNKTEGHKMGSRLLKYTSWDMCGSLLSGPSQLDLSGQFHSIDISALSIIPSLKGIVVRYLLLAVFQEMTKFLLHNGQQKAQLEVREMVLGGVEADGPIHSLVKHPQTSERNLGISPSQPTQTPFLIVVNDSESLLRGEEAHEFLKIYADMIAKYQGKILISHGAR